MPIPVVSLFCGCGGFDLGFTQAGFEVVIALDNNQTVVNSYNHNHGSDIARVTDLSLSTANDILALYEKHSKVDPRGIIGGAPCQTFSKGNVHHDPTHIKHTLPSRFADVLKIFNDSHRCHDVQDKILTISYNGRESIFTEIQDEIDNLCNLIE